MMTQTVNLNLPPPTAVEAKATADRRRLRRKAAAIAAAYVLAGRRAHALLFQPDLTRDNAWRAVHRRRRLAGEKKRRR